MPYPPKITNETKSGHNFLCPRERRQKNVPVTIVDPLVNTSSTVLTVIFYGFFNILRPSRKPFSDVTLYCKAAVSIELIDIISLVLKYIYVYHLILNIFLEITSKHIEGLLPEGRKYIFYETEKIAKEDFQCKQ